MPLPRLRGALKISPHKHEGKDVFMVWQDQESLFEHQVVLPPIAFVVASLLDGRREAGDVRKEIQEQLSVELEIREVEAVVQDLDRHLLLESEKAAGRRREIEQEYLSLPVRPSRFVPGSREEVARALDGYYSAEAGAGRPDGRVGAPLSGILAPHIDFHRGGHCYTFAYRELAERCGADLFVVLGVAHVSPENPFVVSSKSYETALGPAENDREAIAALEKRMGRRIYDCEWVHRSEHSAEFQVAFLKHARPGVPFTVVPILCSAFERWCGSASPSTAPEVEEFLGALGEVLRGRKACIIAGVDFAHVGPVFGDDVKIDKKLVEWMMAGDTRSLQTLSEGSAEAFWNSVVSDGNARHVCGLSATYAAMRLLGDVEGKVHKYGFAPDPLGGLVSFASMSFAPRSRIVLP
jgi:hypothetical protein